MRSLILESDWECLFHKYDISLPNNVVLSQFWSTSNTPQKMTRYRFKSFNKELKSLGAPYRLRRSAHGEGYYILIKK